MATDRADLPPGSGSTATGESSGAIWKPLPRRKSGGRSVLYGADDRGQYGAACATGDRLRHNTAHAEISRLCCRQDRRQQQGSDLPEQPAADEARDDVSKRAQIECGRRFAGANAAEAPATRLIRICSMPISW